MAFYRFKFGTDPIVFHFIIARYHTNLTLIFQSDLSRANDMASGEKTYFNPVDADLFVIGKCLDI
ncbi:hypothetical protein D3C86_1667230 [compost metagenome]